MSLYENNAFCLLDSPGDAAIRDIQIALKNLEHRAEFGRALDYEHVPFFIKSTLSNASNLSSRPKTDSRGYLLRLYRQISEIIFQPAERLRERVFWFDSFKGAFLPDLKALSQKDTTEPLNNWQESLKDNIQLSLFETAAHRIAITHNLAVYLHAFCLFCDPQAKNKKEWLKALAFWKICIENETFWERLYDIEAVCDGETAGGQDIINLRKNIAGILLRQNTDLTKKALQQGDYQTALRHYMIIKASGFPPAEIDQQLIQIIDFLIEQVELRCKVAEEDIEDLSGENSKGIIDKKCKQIHREFHRHAAQTVKFLEKCLPADDDRTLSARQELSLCLREISIALNNKVKNYSKATEIITEAVELAQGTGVWYKLGSDFKIMLSNLCRNVAEELEAAIDDSENAAAAGNACTTAFGRFLDEIFPAYDKFIELWREDECIIDDIKGNIVECLRSIHLHYCIDAQDFKQAERVLLRAKEIAGDSPASLLIPGGGEDHLTIDEDEENGDETFKCHICGADVPYDAVKCPGCGVVFEVEEVEEFEAGEEETEVKINNSTKSMQQQNISSRETDSSKKHYDIGEETISQVHPWVRYLARCIDYLLFSLIAGFVSGIVAPSLLDAPEIFLNMLLLFIWVFVEASLLSTWGTTPGKWLLKTTLRDLAGSKLTFSRALGRSFSVWWRGMGIGFPVVKLITIIVAYEKLTKEGITTWDQEGGFVVSHKKISTLRVIVTILFFMGYFLLNVYAGQS